jgi:hypothetical protein
MSSHEVIPLMGLQKSVKTFSRVWCLTDFWQPLSGVAFLALRGIALYLECLIILERNCLIFRMPYWPWQELPNIWNAFLVLWGIALYLECLIGLERNCLIFGMPYWPGWFGSTCIFCYMNFRLHFISTDMDAVLHNAFDSWWFVE